MEWQNAIRGQLMAQQAEAEYTRELVDQCLYLSPLWKRHADLDQTGDWRGQQGS